MTPLILVAFFLVACSSSSNSPLTLTHQQQVDQRVASLHKVPGRQLRQVFRQAKLTFPPRQLQFIALKHERTVEMWTYEPTVQRWVYVKSYPFTAFSGGIGPKLREGDRQIPEGIYQIDFLNPNSKFHLSLKVNYPNGFDVLQAQYAGRTDLGGDIFLHGRASTIGCIPVGDKNIEEIFYLVGKTPKQTAGIIIAPYDLRRQPILNHTSLPWVSELYFNIQRAMQPYRR